MEESWVVTRVWTVLSCCCTPDQHRPGHHNTTLTDYGEVSIYMAIGLIMAGRQAVSLFIRIKPQAQNTCIAILK